MNMMDSRKFRRKRKALKVEEPAEEDLAPIPPLETREDRLARREAEAEAIHQAEALRMAEEAEAHRRAAEAEARRLAEEVEAERLAEEARIAAHREAKRLAEEARLAAEAAEKARREQERAEAIARARAEKNRRLAEERAAAEAQRQAEEKARADAAERARRAEEERIAAEEEARRDAEARAVAEAEARRQADEQARAEAAERARRAEEERVAAEAKARRDAEARAEDEAEARRQAEEQARAEAAERARVEAAAAARKADKARRIEAARQAEEQRIAEQAEAVRAARLTEIEQTRRTVPPTPLPLTPAQRAPEDPAPEHDDLWFDIPVAKFDLNHLNRNRIITADRLDPAHTTFDVLRTRLMHALNEKGWKRVAITSPGKDCGKTFTTANLAISLSRQENTRTLVMDFDMRRPSLHQVMGVDGPGSLGDVLRGALEPEDHFLRMGANSFDAGRNIAFALNTVAEPYASELLQDPRTERALRHIEDVLHPDVMLFDLPPALFYDDVIAFQPMFDGVLLVVGGGLTTEREIKEVERRLGPDTPLLGMVLNKAEGTGVERYTY